MATNVNVFSYAFLDQRIRITAQIETQRSEVLFPFYTACWLIPQSKANEYLNGVFKINTFYKVKENEYATKCLGEFLDGATRFYNQQHTEANLGFIVFPDSFALNPDQPDVMTDYLDAPQANRLAVMNNCLGAIGRNAIYVGIAETDPKRYSQMMDDFRQCDTDLQYVKAKLRNTLCATEEELSDIINDYKAFGGTLEIINQVKAPEDTDVFSFKNRGDFVIGGALLNPYLPKGGNTTYPVGMGLDGTIVNITDADIEYSPERANLDYITRQYLTYFQVAGDDPTEVLVAGGGVYFQGQSIPVNMFLVAKYIEYMLRKSLYSNMLDNKSGVANVEIYRKAISETMTSIEIFVGFLLESCTSKSYTQAEINASVVDKEVRLSDCIKATTYPTYLFTKATFGLAIQ